MSEEVMRDYLTDALKSFKAHKKLAEKAIEQVKDDELFATLDEEANSIAVVMKHMAGNMLSRWTDFLTSDGEKPDRQRDMEFVILPETTKDDVMAYWQRGWQCVFDAIEPLTVADLEKRVFIRGEEHTVVQAINRQMTHYAYHIGQIVFLAKHFRSTEWKTLSVPKNKSAEFNAFLATANRSADKEEQLDAVIEFARRGQEGKG
ncbi:MAG TPA: DUF1572 family protein [Pyrinomonadaceae bacterium]